MPEALSPKSRILYEKVKQFIEKEVLPREDEFMHYADGPHQWTPNPKIEKLKVKKIISNIISKTEEVGRK